MATLPTALEVTFDAHEYHLAEAEEAQLREKLDGLARQVDHFPVAELRVHIEGVRSNQVVVKLTLFLPGTTLAVNDYDLVLQPAFDRCLDSLLHELDGYKDRLNRISESAQAEERTAFDLRPSVLIDESELDRAVQDGDYVVFHRLMSPLDSELRMRIGRWVQRYPDLNAAIGERLDIADIAEEVWLSAFEGYRDRPENVPLGTWLEKMIDPAIKELVEHSDEATENIEAVRTLRDAPEA